MTTAYTSLLGLALPVTGELSGTWGDVVNTSITGLLDTAIAGTTTLSADANVTLSTTTGAANQSRQAIILWTASGTATRTITAPAQSKIYTVINRSTTQSIKIVGAGPTTGVTVRSGATVTVAWNGLDFVEVSVSTLYPTVNISGPMDTGPTDYSLNNAPTVKSNVIDLAAIYLSNPSTEAASFTLTSLIGYRAEQGTIGASSTVTNQFGFYANSDLTGAQFNYGLYSGLAATAAVTISSVNGTGSTVTVDTATSHGLVTGDSVLIAGVSNATMTAGSYNGGPYTITLVDANTFTFNSSATSSAAVTSGGNVVKSNNWNVYAGGTGNNWFGGPTVKSVSSTLPALRITQTGTGNALLVEDSTNPDTSPFVVDNAGNVRIGASEASDTGIGGVVIPALEVIRSSTVATYPIAVIKSYSATVAAAGMLALGHSKSATVGTEAATASGDALGYISFEGVNSSSAVTAGAYIYGLQDAAVGATYVPGALTFWTGTNAASPAERLRIDSAGNMGLRVTPSAWNSSYPSIQVETASLTGVNALSYFALGANAYISTSNDDTGAKYIVDGYATRFKSESGVFKWQIAASGTAGDTISFTQAMTLNASGQLTLGNTSTAFDSTAFAVVGSGTGDSGLAIYTSNATAGYLQFADGTSGAEEYRGFIKYDHSTNAMSFSTNSTARTEAEMTIDSSGNMGLGVTPKAWTSFSAFQLGENGSIAANDFGTDNAQVILGNNIYYDGSYRYIAANDSATLYQQIAGAHYWLTAAPGTADNVISFTTAMTIASSGNVGISTSSPSSLFTVNGESNISNVLFKQNVAAYTTGSSLPVIARASGFTGVYTSGALLLQARSDAAAEIAFITGTTPTERMRIDSSGNVGIGTQSPAAPLDVNGSIVTRASGGEGGQVSFNNPDNASVGLTVDVSSADTARVFQSRNNSVMQIGQLAGTGGIVTLHTAAFERLRITSAGNVGIGTASPQAALDLGDGSGGKAITWGGTNGAARYASIFGAYSSASLVLARGFTGSTLADTYVSTYTGTTANTGIRLDSAGFINFFTDASSLQTANNAFVPTPRMRIDSDGNVLVTSAASLGYGTGSGGTVTQTASKATAVTLNKPTGRITMNNAALAANTTVAFTVTNSLVATTDTVVCNLNFNSVNYQAWVYRVNAGSFEIAVRNISGGSLSEAVVLNFAIINGATS